MNTDIRKNVTAHPPLTQAGPELIRRVTKAVRRADLDHERLGGGARHWVMECFLPRLEEEGLVLMPKGLRGPLRDRHPSTSSPQERPPCP